MAPILLVGSLLETRAVSYTKEVEAGGSSIDFNWLNGVRHISFVLRIMAVLRIDFIGQIFTHLKVNQKAYIRKYIIEPENPIVDYLHMLSAPPRQIACTWSSRLFY